MQAAWDAVVATEPPASMSDVEKAAFQTYKDINLTVATPNNSQGNELFIFLSYVTEHCGERSVSAPPTGSNVSVGTFCAEYKKFVDISNASKDISELRTRAAKVRQLGFPTDMPPAARTGFLGMITVYDPSPVDSTGSESVAFISYMATRCEEFK